MHQPSPALSHPPIPHPACPTMHQIEDEIREAFSVHMTEHSCPSAMPHLQKARGMLLAMDEELGKLREFRKRATKIIAKHSEDEACVDLFNWADENLPPL